LYAYFFDTAMAARVQSTKIHVIFEHSREGGVPLQPANLSFFFITSRHDD
jgi:hypothetical protein